ncbi:biotin transporter BioY [Tuberibacillus sp. Marseille-P3662]|uniref:biotin transporter BioY n=1 Tax=Tuberibacillus sp. Marseille-P3662 TaxID=1965358 RepID=UPI000A1C9AB9|nr:biotin transporter BioY [Tuberibacillus sp. Marseille-P3662]
MKWNARDLVLAALFAALMAIGANITVLIPPVAGVPLTFQPFFAVIAGLLLGSRLGPVSMIVYMLIGLAGVPVFAQMLGGIGVTMKQDFGFILSFIAVAYISGKIVETTPSPSMKHFFLAAYAGLFVNYIIGTHWMYMALNFWINTPIPYWTTWTSMVPFFIKDIIFIFIAALLGERVFYSIYNRQRPAGRSF